MMKDAEGQVVSRNVYWLAGDSRDFQQLSRLPQATLRVKATATRNGEMMRITVKLWNTGLVVALQNKITLLNATTGGRILPAYYSDNYVSLLPGESQTVEIQYPAGTTPALTLRGFNLAQRNVELTEER
jgi:hypothetical protein